MTIGIVLAALANITWLIWAVARAHTEGKL
jgi:hypothetical protein